MLSRNRNLLACIASVTAIASIGCGMQIEKFSGSAQPAIATISITPQSPSLLIKQTTQLDAVALYANGLSTNITSTAGWTSSAPAVATVDGQGLLTCQSSGSSRVSALSEGVTAGTSLTCSAPRITDIHLSSAPVVIRSESPYQYQMMVDYAGGTTADVTANTSWVTDPSIASISSNGLVSCNNPGSTTLSGSFSGITIHSSFTCVLRSITPNPVFVEAAKTFDGPFASWTDVKAVFGAKGDGVTDDTSALQAALNSLTRSTPVLWIPRGTYLITRPLTISGIENITILGEDPLTTSIVWGGPQKGTMFTLSGVDGFNLGRITWDGRGTTGVALEVTWDKISNYYPSRNLIHDSRFFNSAVGFLTGVGGGDSGELTVDRVHFDHNSTAGIINKGTLNFNVIDSLFTDNGMGIDPEGSAFNVTNSVFVRSTSTDLALNSSGPFSIRNNLSYNSQQFFWTGGTGALSNIIIQGNTVYHTGSVPMINGMPGALLLMDNKFVNLDPSFHVMAISGSPRYFMSVGNSYSVSQPYGPACGQCSGVGVYTSVDEATRATDPVLSLIIPTEVYIPPLSHRRVFEVPAGSNGDAIQKAINAAIAAGGIVHLPAGNYNIYQTLTIPPNTSVGMLGDGLLSQLVASNSLQGPILSIYGKSVQLEDLGFYSYSSSSSTDQIELHEPDTPNTRIICDECSINGSDLEVDGMDDAAIEFKVATINNSPNWAQIVHGGIARQDGIETLGSLGEFMTSSSGYQVDLGGHLLIGDGWHDDGQGSSQFVLTGDGSVTQQGGAIYSPSSTPAMGLNNYKGRLSLLGIGTNSYLSVDAVSSANVFVGAVDQLTGQNPVSSSGTSASITEISDSTTTSNIDNLVYLPDTPTTPSYIEQMMSTARTQTLSPRKPISFDSTNVKMTRIVSQINSGGVAVRIMDSVASRIVGSYLITAANGGVTPLQLTCGSGEISMAGPWTLQDGGDGFYGLVNMGALLSEEVTVHGDGDIVAMVSAMSSARDRWIISQNGDGSAKIVNRATGNVLTQSNTGCAYAASDTGALKQQWLVSGASTISSPLPENVPTVTSISPAVGDISGGTSVTIAGSGFIGATAVAFGSTSAGSFTVESDTSIIAVSPAGTIGTVDVTVTSSLGTSATSTSDKFIYNSWQNTSWQLRQKITINPTLVGGGTEDETNFPVLISLSGLSNINTNGSDIRFAASDGVTLLPREIESYASGTLTAWVKVPTVSHTASTSIYMYYGNTAATEPAAGSIYGSQAVWSSNYAGVWHLNEGSGNTAYDSTNNGNTGTWGWTEKAGTNGNYSPAGKIGAWAGAFNGRSPYYAAVYTNLDVDSSAMSSTTWSAWIYPTSTGTDGGDVAVFGEMGPYGSRDLLSSHYENGYYSVVYGPGNYWSPAYKPLNQWQHITLVYTPADVYFYLDGVKYDLGQAPTNATTSSGDLDIGMDLNGQFFYGLISEAHVSTVARSAGWISTEYNNQNSPSSFYTASSPMPPNIATSAPIVTALSPNFGNISGGNSVTITGSGFTGTTAVNFGSTPATSFTASGDTSITAVSPAGTAKTVDVTVVNSLGTSAANSADHFMYYATPVVTGLSAVSGSTLGGTNVTITGSGFTGTTAVAFGSTPAASFTASGDTSITAISPAGTAGTVNITVTNPVGTSASSLADEFTYSVASTTPAFTASSSETIGVNAMSPMGFSTLPYFKADGTDSYDSSSHDPTGDNGDFGHDLYQDPSNGDNVLLDVKGPGEIDGVWFTNYSPTAPLRIYFDGSSTPAVNMPLGNLLDGANAPFVQPLVGYSNASDTDDGMGRSGYYINLPMEFAKSVKVEMTGMVGYYNIYYRTFATSTGVTTFDPTPSDSNYQSPSAAAALWSNTTVDPKSTSGNIGFSGTGSIGAWASSTIANITGIGSVNSIKFQVASSSDNDATLGNVWIEMYFDGQASPSYAPFNMFFAESQYGTTHSLPVGKDASGTYYCYFPMPYDQSAKIVLVNQNGYAVNLAYQVQYNTAPYLGLGNSAGYFSTYYNNSSITPLVAGQNYELLNVTSTKGQYVGMVYTAPYGAYLEGNTEVYVDDSLSPQIQGTGTDNWFGGAYYFQDGPFTQATHGVTIFPATSSIEAYRFDLNDPISFNSSITLGIQHGATDYDGGTVSSLAYYYALPSSSTLTLTDTLAVGSSTSRTNHGYTVNGEVSTPTNSYYYEGETDGFYGPLITDTGDTMTGHTQFTVAVNPVNKGVKLRRRLDYSTLNQKAEVYVNGSLMGIWYDAGQNTTLNWRDSDFEIPAAYTKGKNSLNIELVYDNTGGTAWTEYEYWAYSYLDIDDTPLTTTASPGGGSSNFSRICGSLKYYPWKKTGPDGCTQSQALQ